MKRTSFTLLVLFSAISLLFAACAPQPAATASNDDGNQTVIVVEGDNSGDITVIQGVDSNNTNSGVPAATEAAPTPTEAPVEENTSVCFYSAWHDGWQNGPERIHQDGILNRAELENGMSMQASWYKWTSTQKVDGYTVPDGFEPNNDGLQVLICDDVAYMPDRDGSSEMPFWFISYVQLTSDGLLICKDDTGTPGNWDGECSGTQTVVEAIPLDEINVPGDFQQNWTSLMDLMDSWSGNTPAYGTIENAWTTTK